jgi:hypothetical protein
MQNLKDKLVHKINSTVIVPSANSFQNSNLNPFSYFNSTPLSAASSAGGGGGNKTSAQHQSGTCSLSLKSASNNRFEVPGNF